MMVSDQKIWTPEFREEAVRMVITHSRPIASVARELDIQASTLSKWVGKYRKEHPQDEPLTLSERTQLQEAQQRNREMERQVRELRMENEFLKKCAAHFARNHR
jgi:transposase-like protein